MKRLFTLIIVCFVLLSITLSISAQDNAQVTESDCWFGSTFGRDIDCAYVTVPEDHNQADGATIQIATALIHSVNPNKQADPVLYIFGGPGHAFAGITPAMIQHFGIAAVLMNRDVIIVDQRGMGLSQPNLICNPFRDSSEIFPTPLVLAGLIQRMAQCPSEFEAEGINWQTYTTEQNAADLAMIPASLGYEEYNIYAVSYGTLPAQIILRDYPEGVRSVVLDSVAALDSNIFEDSALGFSEGFANMEADCQADFACRLAYPNLRENFYNLYSQLQDNPVTLSVDGTEIKVTGEMFANFVKMQLQSKASVQTIPGFLKAFEVEDYDVAIPFLRPLVNASVEDFPNQALYMTMMCPQSAPYTNREAINEAQSAYDEPFRAAGLGVTNFIQCNLWSGIEAQNIELAQSDIPTLLLAGSYDPQTPPEFAYHVAENLSNSYTFVLPYTGHVATETTCGQQLIVGFYNEPNQAPDSSCLSEISAPGFILHTTVTRFPIQIALLLIGITALFGSGQALFAGLRGFRRIAWWASFRRLGYMPLVAAAVMYFLIVIDTAVLPSEFGKLGILQSLMPIFIALQASAIFSAGDEPSLEIQLAAPRHISWLVLERLLTVFITYGLIAAGGVILALWRDPAQDYAMLAFSWIAPAIFLSGLGVFITIRSRNIALGVLTIGFLWFIFGLFSNLLLPGTSFPPPMHLVQPFLWPFHIHATLDDLSLMDFWINRLMMSSTGIGLIMAAIHGLADAENVLLNSGRRGKSTDKSAPPNVIQSLKPHISVQAVRTQINWLAQIWAIVKYESMMRWRSRGLPVFVLSPLAIFGIFMISLAGDSSGALSIAAEGLMSPEQLAIVKGETLVFFAAAIFFVPVIYLYPVLVADAVPADSSKGVKELLNAIAMPDWVYLIGKMLGASIAGMIGLSISVTCIALMYRYFGPYYPVPYIDMGLGLALTQIILTSFAILIGASQAGARRAIALVIALLIVPEFLQSVEFISWLLPSRIDFMMIFLNSASEATGTFPLTTRGFVVFDTQFLQILMTSIFQLMLVGTLVLLWRRYRQS